MSEQLSNNNTVQLGCGTLIVIALIVMLFSGGNDSRKVRNELEDLSQQLDRLERKIDALSDRVASQASAQPLERK